MQWIFYRFLRVIISSSAVYRKLVGLVVDLLLSLINGELEFFLRKDFPREQQIFCRHNGEEFAGNSDI
jgi:hypothetical protein